MEYIVFLAVFLALALGFSLFYGLAFKQIWMSTSSKLTKSRWFHEAWFNFVGSLIGWICMFAIYESLFNFPWQTLVINISWQHIILFVIGILGITGLLPYTLWSVSRGIDEFIKKILGEKS